MEKIICSGALFYTLDTHRFLFLHRTKGKQNNLWGLVGGTNEGAETPWESLKREISEEIGSVKIKKTIPCYGISCSIDRYCFRSSPICRYGD